MNSSVDQSPILGIGHEHDSGIALFEPAGLTFAANEERFNRQKFTKALPEAALASLLKTTKRHGDDISAVAVGSCMNSPTVVEDWMKVPLPFRAIFEFLSLTRLDRLFFGTVAGATFVARTIATVTNPLRMYRLRALLRRHGVRAPMRLFDHHYVHATTAFVGSGFARALVITIDAQGDGLCSTVYRAEGNIMTRMNAIAFYHSPGNYYSYITHMFGFKTGREGKVTGLAAYGNPEKTIGIFRDRLRFDSKRMTFVNRGKYRNAEMRHLKKRLASFSREDIAAGIQRLLEEVVTEYVKHAVRRYAGGRASVALAGGVFANVKLNQRIAELSEVEKIFIYPHMGDGGMAAGAAMALALERGWKRPGNLPHCYMGPEFSNEEIERVLREAGVQYERPEPLTAELAEMLAQGKIVALYRGRMEYGPRALGNRSILSQATDQNVNDWLNKRLKRSEFMPFAPILRREDLPLYFQGYEKCEKALEFMTITLDALPRCKQEAPAVVHVDGTARPQVVLPETNAFVHELLGAYAKRSGLRVLINTSFNMHEEPIVCTPADALRAFQQGGLDVLSIGPFIVRSSPSAF